jgi:hypothetical protein
MISSRRFVAELSLENGQTMFLEVAQELLNLPVLAKFYITLARDSQQQI